MFPLPECESPRNTQQRQLPLGKMEEEMKILEGKITQSPIWKNDRPDRSPAKSGLPRNTVQTPNQNIPAPKKRYNVWANEVWPGKPEVAETGPKCL